jgi:hypothetical protein
MEKSEDSNLEYILKLWPLNISSRTVGTEILFYIRILHILIIKQTLHLMISNRSRPHARYNVHSLNSCTESDGFQY